MVAYLVFIQKSWFRILYSIIPILQIIELFNYIDLNNRKIKDLILSAQLNDFSFRLPTNTKNKSFNELNGALNKINLNLSKLYKSNFTNLYFVETLINQAQVGLLTLDQENKIYFVNKSFLSLTGILKATLHEKIDTVSADLWEKIKNLTINDKITFSINVGGQQRILLFQVSEFILENKRYRLFSAQNIKSEIDSIEIDSWKKLIRIISHEILNTTTPILSLSNTLHDIINDQALDQKAIIGKLKPGLEVIIDRSEGLIKFTNAFNTISKIPEPYKEILSTADLINGMHTLFLEELKKRKIVFDYKILHSADKIYADKYQLEQVLINLIKNAIEAIGNNSEGNISLLVYKTIKGNTGIELTDNGCGIPTEKLEQVFMPFYTTKSTGSGIGLAFTKQIINLHKGEINIISAPGQGTKMTIEIPSDNSSLKN